MTDLNKVDQSRCFVCDKTFEHTMYDDTNFANHLCIDGKIIRIFKFDTGFYDSRKMFVNEINLISSFVVIHNEYNYDYFHVLLVYNQSKKYNKMYLNLNNNNIIQLDQKDFIEFYDNLRTCLNYIKKYVENIMFI